MSDTPCWTGLNAEVIKCNPKDVLHDIVPERMMEHVERRSSRLEREWRRHQGCYFDGHRFSLQSARGNGKGKQVSEQRSSHSPRIVVPCPSAVLCPVFAAPAETWRHNRAVFRKKNGPDIKGKRKGKTKTGKIKVKSQSQCTTSKDRDILRSVG